MLTTSVGVFRDFLPSQQIGKSFIQSVFGFSVAQEALRCDLRLCTRFSMPSENISSVVSIVFIRVLSHFLHPDAAAGNLSRPIRSRMAWNNSRGTATIAPFTA